MMRAAKCLVDTAEYDALLDVLRAAKQLVDKVEAVHEHPTYREIWTLAHIHDRPYQGPTYEQELYALRTALQRAAREQPGTDEPRSA